MDLLIIAFVACVAFVAFGAPLIFTPLTLTGIVPLFTLRRAHAITALGLICLFTITLVVANMIRGSVSNVQLSRKVTTLLGGSIALGMLALLFAQAFYFEFAMPVVARRDSFFSLFAIHRHIAIPVLWPVSLAVHQLAKAAPPRTIFHPFAVFLHLTVASLTIIASTTSLIEFVENSQPRTIIELVAERTGIAPYAIPILEVAEWVWEYAGVSWAMLRVSASVFVVFLVCLGYALTGPTRFHEPASPVTIALLVFHVSLSLWDLVPLFMILALRFVAHLLRISPVVLALKQLSLKMHGSGNEGEAERRLALRHRIHNAVTFEDWCRAEAELEELEGRGAWRDTDGSKVYDHERVATALLMLRRETEKATRTGNVHGLVELLRSVLHRNFANINDPQLFQHPAVGTKKQVEALLDETERAMKFVVAHDWGLEFDSVAKAEFVASASHIVGRSALCLSGGGSLGMFHMGLWHELVAHGVLPNIISGSSGGAIVAGFLACNSDSELRSWMRPGLTETIQNSLTDDRGGIVKYFDSYWTMLCRFVRRGIMVDREQFLRVLAPTGMGDLTFKEAYAKTGRLVNITTSTKDLGGTLLLNHLTSPTVLVRSAVQCSCSLNGVMHPGPLLTKTADGRIVEMNSAGTKFRDGSFQHDIPMRELSAQFAVQHFIISQVNPYLSLFVKDSTRQSSLLETIQSFLAKRLRYRLKMYVRLNMLPAELHAMAQQRFTGNKHDITLSPRMDMHDLTWRILSHPTVESMRHFVLEGKRMAWPHLRRMQYQMQLELAIAKLSAMVGLDTTRKTKQV